MKTDFGKATGKVRAWYDCAPKVWWPLFIGWLWVLVFPLPASGAFLVGMSIVAELFYGQLHYRQWLSWYLDSHHPIIVCNGTDGRFYLRCHKIEVVGSMDGFQSSVRSLLVLSKDVEWHDVNALHIESGMITDPEVSEMWWYKQTIKRIEQRITFWIAFSVVMGTLFWGYSCCWGGLFNIV